jgi:hypothetical protein
LFSFAFQRLASRHLNARPLAAPPAAASSFNSPSSFGAAVVSGNHTSCGLGPQLGRKKCVRDFRSAAAAIWVKSAAACPPRCCCWSQEENKVKAKTTCTVNLGQALVGDDSVSCPLLSIDDFDEHWHSLAEFE